MDVAAYELRAHYDGPENRMESSSDQLRTIYKMFTDTGLDEVVGGHPGLVTLTSEALIEGLTAPEIAAALEVNLNTVYGRLRQARKRFELTLSERARAGGATA